MIPNDLFYNHKNYSENQNSEQDLFLNTARSFGRCMNSNGDWIVSWTRVAFRKAALKLRVTFRYCRKLAVYSYFLNIKMETSKIFIKIFQLGENLK